MTKPEYAAISCFMVDCLTNRAFVMSLGVMPDLIPWPLPYPQSVKGECKAHHGPIWIGPEQQKLIEKMPETEVIEEKEGSPKEQRFSVQAKAS